MFDKARAAWNVNKGKIARKLLIYGGIGVGLVAVGYLHALDEENQAAAKPQPETDVFVVHENDQNN